MGLCQKLHYYLLDLLTQPLLYFQSHDKEYRNSTIIYRFLFNVCQ